MLAWQIPNQDLHTDLGLHVQQLLLRELLKVYSSLNESVMNILSTLI